MTSVNRILIATLALLSAASVVWADARPNPYDPIVTRNPFGIKPPPPAPPPEQAPQPPLNLPKVVLTGISTMGLKPQALLEVTEQEQGKPAVVKKPIVREGEKDGSIEVISIDIANSMVRIRNGPVETNITFEIAKATTAGPGGPGTMPPISVPQPGGGAFRPAAQGLAVPNTTPTSSFGYERSNGGGRGAGVTTYGASGAAASEKPLPLRQVRTDLPGFQPTPETSTSPGTELLRSTARARGLPSPPMIPQIPAPPAAQ